MPWRKGNKLPVVAEEQAEGRTREIYDEIKGALGFPHVTVPHQAYGVHPEFLEMHWRALRPVVESGEFLQLAGRIRAGRLHAHPQLF
jgi:hypothetical protein